MGEAGSTALPEELATGPVLPCGSAAARAGAEAVAGEGPPAGGSGAWPQASRARRMGRTANFFILRCPGPIDPAVRASITVIEDALILHKEAPHRNV